MYIHIIHSNTTGAVIARLTALLRGDITYDLGNNANLRRHNLGILYYTAYLIKPNISGVTLAIIKLM